MVAEKEEKLDSYFQSTSLVDLLTRRAKEDGDKLAYLFLHNGETEGSRLTYMALDRACRSLAAKLQTLGYAGERVLLLFPQGLDYVVAFYACLYAGFIAPPTPHDRRGIYPESKGLPKTLKPRSC